MSIISFISGNDTPVGEQWVDDRIELMEKKKNGTKGGRLLTKGEMVTANDLWKMHAK